MVLRLPCVAACLAGLCFVATAGPSESVWTSKGGDVRPVALTGILFFSYGEEQETVEFYLREATTSARRIKDLNPGTNITIVTNPGISPDLTTAFDMVVEIDEQYIVPGSGQAYSNGIHKQWLTRLAYLSRSPYEFTLALDSQALCCSTAVASILYDLRRENYDIAFAVQGPKLLGPHNWALAYHLNFNTRRMFERWWNLQLAFGSHNTDQFTLHMAAGSLALQDKLSVGILSENVALAAVRYDHYVNQYPKLSTLVDPRPMTFLHHAALSPEDEERSCAELNGDSSRPRVLILPKPFSGPSEVEDERDFPEFQVVYSEEELAEAAIEAAGGIEENALYFRGLDWENKSEKWGYVATPWKEHYPNCWDDLAKDVNKGVHRIYRNPENIWDSDKFVEEFGNDNLVWTPLEAKARDTP